MSFPSIAQVFYSSVGLTVSLASSIANPLVSTVCYLFPNFAVLANAAKVRNRVDESQEHLFPEKERTIALDKIERLKAAAGIDRKVITYASTKTDRIYQGVGGRYSLTPPVIEIPQFDLFRNQRFGSLGNEKKGKELEKDPWRFTDRETSFLIMRAFGQIKNNDTLWKLASKIAIAVAVFLFHFTSISWITIVSIIGTSLLFYLAVDRFYEESLDRIAIKSLTRHFVEEKCGGEREAILSAISVLRKMQKQNLYFRENKRHVGKILYTEEGDPRFLNAPMLRTRIERLERMLAQRPEKTTKSFSTTREIFGKFLPL